MCIYCVPVIELSCVSVYICLYVCMYFFPPQQSHLKDSVLVLELSFGRQEEGACVGFRFSLV